MTINTYTRTTPGVSSFYGRLSKSWLWILLLGVAFILMGLAGLSMTVILTMGTMLLIGLALIITGALQLVHVLQCSNWQGAVWHLFIAIFYIIIGVAFASDPEIATIYITPILGSCIVAIGFLRLMLGIQLRALSDSWSIISLSALLSIVFGGLILFQWPDSSFWTIGLIVAVELLSQGIAYVLVGLAAKPETR